MSIVLIGATSGSITLSEPAVAGTTTLDLPATSGTVVVGSAAVSAAGQIPFSTNGTTYTPTAKIVSGTAVASTSGTSIDFTSIPSWVKRVTIMLNGTSTNGSSIPQFQLGSSSIQTTGYEATGTGFQGSALLGSGVYTTGFPIGGDNTAASLYSGNIVFTSFGSNTWICSMSGAANNGGTGRTFVGGGRVTLSGVLDRLRVTTTNGTDTFDAGSINILYE